MNDKKQIEEIKQIIYNDYKQWLDVTGCIPKGTTYYAECLGGAIDCAEKLYNAGYRKLPENAVVLTVKQCMEIVEDNYDIGYNHARKETAKEIYQKGKEVFGEDFDKTGLGEYILANFLSQNNTVRR